MSFFDGIYSAYSPMGSQGQQQGLGYNYSNPNPFGASKKISGLGDVSEIDAIPKPAAQAPITTSTLSQNDPYGVNFTPDMNQSGMSNLSKTFNINNYGGQSFGSSYQAPNMDFLSGLSNSPLSNTVSQFNKYFQDLANFYDQGGVRDQIQQSYIDPAWALNNDPNVQNFGARNTNNDYLTNLHNQLFSTDYNSQVDKAKAAYMDILNKYRSTGAFGFDGNYTFTGNGGF